MDGVSVSISKEAERSIAASSMFPGFRFSPIDEELILYYLTKKLDGFHKCVEVIPEVDICKFEPWDLPSKAIIKSDQEWFFFSPRGKKYPNGSQSKRATEIGYWKATGKERAVKSGSNVIGTKRTLVFHIGRAPKGERTEWIMHEYCMSGKAQDALVVCRLRRKCDYHAMNNVPDGEMNQSSNPSMLMASRGTYSNCGMGLIDNNTPGRDKQTVECSFKKSSSSHDSHSVEQINSASQSNWKNKDYAFQPESTSINHVGNEDDLFAEILNDSIIQLDECLHPSTFGAQPMLANNGTVPVVPRIFNNPSHNHVVQRVSPAQGTANRRIRLRKLRRLGPRKEELEEGSGENMVNSKSRRFFKKVPEGWMRISKNCSRLYVLVITMALLILMMGYSTGPAYFY
ncbi:NAC domain-containing protein 89-like [Chenopodium quinoa]|uniref:NAC domain-containing protein 89-like n=1 Tax=Chenopodium quinoa TaxID=63459 RepID=UPI000B78A330|nr:NAC domain-containing protein 89-like [Chenopodium quinoa]